MVGYLLLESMDELFFVCNVNLVASTDYFQEVAAGKTATVNFTLTSAAGVIPNAPIVTTVVYVDPIQAQTIGKTSTYGVGDIRESDWLESTKNMSVPPVTLSSPNFPIKVVYGSKITTDANGRASVSFPLENYGIYTVIATTETSVGTGATIVPIIGERYVPKINLTQIGKFAGLPVFENPKSIGESLSIGVTLPTGVTTNVSAAISPLNLTKYVTGNVTGINNKESKIENVLMNGTGSLELTVNGPIAMIGVMTYKTLQNGATEGNIVLGILLTSQVGVKVTGPTLIVPGSTYTLTLNTSSDVGKVDTTFGLGTLSNGLDLYGLDTTQITKYIYGVASKRIPEPSWEVVKEFQSIAFGTGDKANIAITNLASRGDYSIITVSTIIDNIGRKLVAVGFISPQIQGKVIGTTISSTVIGVEVSRPTIGLLIPIKVEGDGVAIAGAIVEVLKDGEIVKSTTTSSTGYADVILTNPGNYTISIKKDGYVLSQKNLTVGSLMPFNVTVLTSNPTVGKTISVKILNKENNTAVSGVKIKLELGNTVLNGTSNEYGIVDLTVDKDGSYTLTVEKEGYEKTTTYVNVAKEKKKEPGFIPGFELITLVAAGMGIWLLMRRKRI
jgi:hypothetical protein